MSSIPLGPKVPSNHDSFPRDGFDEEMMELLMIFAEEDTAESSMDPLESAMMHTVKDVSNDSASSMKASLGPKKYQGLIFPPTNEDDETNSEVLSETSVSTESPDTVQCTGKTNFLKEPSKYDYRYGKKRLSPGFRKYCLSENTDLFRVTFKCGLDRHGSPCEHRIGIFHTLRDDV